MRAVVLTAPAAERRQRELAALLVSRGARAGDRVALTSGDGMTVEGICFVAAALRLGIIPVILNGALLPEERARLLVDAEVRTAFDERALHLFTVPHPTIGPPLAPVPLGRPMLFTSGTTGAPRGVFTGTLDEHDAEALAREEQELWQHDASDRHLVCGAIHHSAPLRFAMATLAAGGSVVLPGRFAADRVAEAIHRHRPTTTFMAPIHLQRVLDHPAAAGLPLGSFRLVAHAGAPCPAELKQRAITRFPLGSVWEFYGSTEGQMTACAPHEWMERPGTVGRARPNRTIRVDRGGVVWCDSPRWARFEYWRDPEKTAAAWRGTEFTVGDLGHLDDDGYLFLDGRRDDLIITGGVNVYPVEVERVLASVGGVQDVVVFPRADEVWGQRVCVAVVGSVTEREVADVAADRLAPYKRPKEVHVVPEIPRSVSGKVRRSRLAEDLGLATP